MSAAVQMTTVRLYGPLGAKFGRVHRLAITSAAEAVRALDTQIKGFGQYLTGSKDRGVGYAVFYGDNNIGKEELRTYSGGREIRIAPVLFGSKRAGIFQIVLGVVLIAAAVIAAPATGGSSLVAAFTQGGFWGAVAGMGASMVLGGIATMLTPMPKGISSRDSDVTKNPHFNGPVNTVAQGSCVPVLHGELIVGSKVASASITISETSYNPRLGGIGSGGSGISKNDPMAEIEL